MDTGLMGVAYCQQIVELLNTHHIDEVEGAILEVGAFIGVLTYHLASWNPQVAVYAVDPFDVTLDATKNDRGEAMNEYYVKYLNGRDQKELYQEGVKGKENVVTIQTTSAHMFEKIPPGVVFRAIIIDGGHDPAVVKQDILSCWTRLSPGGLMFMHDYGHDLPQTTAAIDETLKEVNEVAGWNGYLVPGLSALAVIRVTD